MTKILRQPAHSLFSILSGLGVGLSLMIADHSPTLANAHGGSHSGSQSGSHGRSQSGSQSHLQGGKAVPLTEAAWDLRLDPGGSGQFMTHKGQDSLCLRGGFALAKDVMLGDGTIEYDVSFEDGRGFVGAIFHAQDTLNHERFFMRPQGSGSIDAVQYTPVFGGFQSWKLFYGEGFNGEHAFNFEGWNRVRLDIADGKMAVYVDDMETPLYVVPDLKRNQDSGMMGLFALNPQRVEGCFSNVRYSTQKPDLSFIEAPQPSTEPGLITRWEVSEPIDQALFADRTSLEGVDLDDFEWRTLNTDVSGILNVARTFIPKPGQNAVVIRLNLPAEKAHLQTLDFGYSDFVRVYHNGRVIYGGNNSFQSRNELHLGTIGFFESLFLPLEAGNNEVVLVLSASPQGTAGWGMIGRLNPTP